MSLPFHLGLRHNQHMVSVISPPGRSRDMLGVAYPDDANPRLHILAQWGIDARSPRNAELATIDIPLPRRAQAILSYQIDPALRHQLNTGMTPLADTRREAKAGVKVRVHLGAHHAVLPVEARFGTCAQHDPSELFPGSEVRARHAIASVPRR